VTSSTCYPEYALQGKRVARFPMNDKACTKAFARRYRVWIQRSKQKVWVGSAQDAYTAFALQKRHPGSWIERNGRPVSIAMKEVGPHDWKLVVRKEKKRASVCSIHSDTSISDCGT